jgi:hypothetical protein
VYLSSSGSFVFSDIMIYIYTGILFFFLVQKTCWKEPELYDSQSR